MSEDKQTGAVWFVRGIPAELRNAVKLAADARGVTMGRLVSDAIRQHLSDTEPGGGPAAAAGEDLRAELVELARRVAALEARQTRQDAPAATEAAAGQAMAQNAPAARKTAPRADAKTRMLPADQAAEAVRLHGEGFGERSIAKQIGATRDQVRGALNRAKPAAT